MRIYVVISYDDIKYVGNDLAKAKELAVSNDVRGIDIWIDGKAYGWIVVKTMEESLY